MVDQFQLPLDEDIRRCEAADRGLRRKLEDEAAPIEVAKVNEYAALYARMRAEELK